MKQQLPQGRTLRLLSSVKRIKESRNISCEKIRDELNQLYLNEEDHVSTSSVFKYLGDNPPSMRGEFALALQEWVENNS